MPHLIWPSVDFELGLYLLELERYREELAVLGFWAWWCRVAS